MRRSSTGRSAGIGRVSSGGFGDGHIERPKLTFYWYSVFEIKGPPCNWCRHFSSWAHVFKMCVPGVCTFHFSAHFLFSVDTLLYIRRVHSLAAGRSFKTCAPCRLTKKKKDFEHGYCKVESLIISRFEPPLILNVNGPFLTYFPTLFCGIT